MILARKHELTRHELVASFLYRHYYYNLLRRYSKEYTGSICIIMCSALPYRSYSRLFSSSRVLSCRGTCMFIAIQHFSVALLGYIIATKSVSMHQWCRALAGGWHFWRQVVITLVCAAGAFGATSVLEQAFPHLATGAITMPVKTAGELLLFALSTIVLPAIVEETIFRKQMICLASRTAIICTTLLSAMLFAAEHFVAPWGVLLGVVWALPFSLAYSMTRNVYVPMTAHAIASILINGPTVVMALCVVL